MNRHRRLTVRSWVTLLLFGIAGVGAVVSANADEIRSPMPKQADQTSSLGWIAVAGLSGSIGLGLLAKRLRRTNPERKERLVLKQSLGLRPQVTLCEIEWGNQRLLLSVTSAGCSLLSTMVAQAPDSADNETTA